MNKKILTIILIILSILITGCSNTQDTQKQISKNKSDIASSTTAQLQLSNHENWNCIWSMGDNNKPGWSGDITISNSNEKQFDFSFYASYTTEIIVADGESCLNPHVGLIEGTGYFISENEAYYTNSDYPDYELIFKMNENNTISTKEININTKKAYGLTPFGGLNVTFSGDYSRQNK